MMRPIASQCVRRSASSVQHATLILLCSLVAAGSVLSAQPQPANAQDFILADREAFLRKLDLARPELAAVKAALDKRDIAAAGTAYIAHFRTKDIRFALFDPRDTRKPNPNYRTKYADDCLAGHLRVWLESYEVPPTGINWEKGSLASLARAPFFEEMRNAIFNTRKPKYVRWCVDYFRQYMDAYPIEGFVGKSSKEGYVDPYHVTKPWYWGSVPPRISTVAETLLLIRDYPQVTDEELLHILQRLYEETAYLRTQVDYWVDNRHNCAPGQIKAIAAACALFDDFAASDEWLKQDVQLLVRFIDKSFYPDGWNKEIVTPYSVSTSRQMQLLAYALCDAEGIEALRSRLRPMVVSIAATSNPMGVIPTFGDNNLGKPFYYYINRPLARKLDIPWLKPLIEGTLDPPPPFTVWPVAGQEQWCGYYTMRSGWEPKAKFMMIDCGPWGLCHCHGDRLSFVLVAHGTHFVIDPHGTKYSSTNPDDFISRQEPSFLHNTITIDGVDEFANGFWETDKPLTNRWEHGRCHSLFEGSFSFEPIKPVKWTRRVLFVDKSYWLLQDVLTGEQKTAAVEQNFQFEHDIKVEFRGRMTLATAPNGAKLALVPLDTGLKPQLTIGDKTPHTTYWVYGKPKTKAWGEKGTKQSHGRGWTAYKMQYLMPAPAVTYVGELALPAMITVAMIPLAPGEDVVDMVVVKSQAAATRTVWTLPTAKGALRFTTSLQACEVAE